MKKFVVFDINTCLQKSILGVASICLNPLQILRAANHTNFALYTIEAEAPLGAFNAKIVDNSKIFLGNNQCYGVSQIDISEFHFLTFSPDSLYAQFQSGYVHERRIEDLTKDKLGDCQNNDFLVISSESGPKDWTRCCIDGSELDYGTAIIPISVLYEEEEK